jgi:hypothetical protein
MARAEFSDPAVAAVFRAYPAPVQATLLALRRVTVNVDR